MHSVIVVGLRVFKVISPFKRAVTKETVCTSSNGSFS